MIGEPTPVVNLDGCNPQISAPATTHVDACFAMRHSLMHQLFAALGQAFSLCQLDHACGRVQSRKLCS
jgi:hypothetical protein